MMGATKCGKLFTRKALVVLAHLGALSACLKRQGLDTTDYFPLNVGDAYSYSNTLPCPPDTPRVRYFPFQNQLTTDTVWIEGKKYFVKDRFYLSPDTIRVDEKGNVIIRNWGEDKIFYKLKAAVGDTWSFSIRYKEGDTSLWLANLESRTDSIVVPAGKFQNCLRFRIRYGVGAYVDWLAPDVGLVFRCVDEPIELHEALVRGIRYPQVSSLEENKLSPIGEFVLYQNYPNPFNPSTTISFSLPKSAFVTLKVYNTLGQEVASLVNGETAAGRHEVRWHAGNLPGGVYLCRLRARGFQQMQKMILMK